MALGWGTISMSAINTELNKIPWNGNIWMSHEWLRALSQQPGNPMYMSNFRGKSAVVVTPFAASAPPGSVGNGNENVNVAFTAQCNMIANASGGTPPYYYSWSAGGGAGVVNPNSNICGITYHIPRFGSWITVPVTVVVSDSAGASITINTSAEFQYGVAN